MYRDALFAAALFAAGLMIAGGTATFSVGLGWIIAGVEFAGWTWLLLSGPPGDPEPDPDPADAEVDL